MPSKEEAAVNASISLSPGDGENGGGKEAADPIQSHFVLALMWSLGALLELDDRLKVIQNIFSVSVPLS